MKHIFKKGDKIICIRSCVGGGGYTKGKVYIVRETRPDYEMVATTYDDKGSTTNGFHYSNFILWKPKTSYLPEWL